MIYIKFLNVNVASRKEAKLLLGGTAAFNKALRDKELLFY